MRSEVGGQLPAGRHRATLFLDGRVTSAGLTHDKYPVFIIKPLEVHYLSVYAERAECSKASNPDTCWTKVALQLSLSQIISQIVKEDN